MKGSMHIYFDLTKWDMDQIVNLGLKLNPQRPRQPPAVKNNYCS